MNVAAQERELRTMLAGCMQCGTCSASCPHAARMDLSPRALWRLAQLGAWERILDSESFWLCSACYTCRLRCPRGIETTRAMAALKRLGFALMTREAAAGGSFYSLFMDEAARHGRIREARLMRRYLMGRILSRAPAKGLGEALGFAPLGARLMAAGRLRGHDHTEGPPDLRALYAKARELERAKEA